jgi:hypothetical protein
MRLSARSTIVSLPVALAEEVADVLGKKMKSVSATYKSIISTRLSYLTKVESENPRFLLEVLREQTNWLPNLRSHENVRKAVFLSDEELFKCMYFSKKSKIKRNSFLVTTLKVALEDKKEEMGGVDEK